MISSEERGISPLLPDNVLGAIDHEIKLPRYCNVVFLDAVKYYVAKNCIDNYLTDQHIIVNKMFCSSNPRFTRSNTSFFDLING